MTSNAEIEILDVTDASTFGRLPACADSRFDHRSCDYWEDDVHGSKAARASWWQPARSVPKPKPLPRSDNPFAPAPRGGEGFNPFSLGSEDAETAINPFAPEPESDPGSVEQGDPTKLRLLDRGRVVFGSYAKVLVQRGEPAVYAQFGPLSAYPRAQHVRALYPRLPSAPLPAVITCVATTESERGQRLARTLIDAIVEDLSDRGFAAVEAYPDLTLAPEEASAATPGFWQACGFELAAPDDRYPVMRRELE